MAVWNLPDPTWTADREEYWWMVTNPDGTDRPAIIDLIGAAQANLLPIASPVAPYPTSMVASTPSSADASVAAATSTTGDGAVAADSSPAAAAADITLVLDDRV